MAEDRSKSQGAGAFPSSPDSPHEQSEAGSPPFEGPASSMAEGTGATVALDMARLWVEEHQTTTMLGAFAAGVFVGAMIRD